MAKPELGTKRLCGNCSAKFYDLSKTPIVCPKCHTAMDVSTVAAR
ncbi:MAG: TIGR02300 family protein, partial [Xanthobacteraceae bacterium]